MFFEKLQTKNFDLRADKSQLQSAYDTLNRDVLTNDKKPASVRRYAERALTSAQRVIDNGDATTQEITSEKSKVEQAMQALTNAKSNLRADKNELQTAYNKLIENVSTNGKKPASIRQYETAKARIQNQINDAKNEAERILRKLKFEKSLL
ncbi:hypothetical protein [Staphylococcus epidermidis]|uniref:hypothetical protein n=1 Tax=Staphylococcus epidermidis TaxID=1282 RepID=UPI003204BE6C